MTWPNESRRHSEAARKNRDRGRAHVVQAARKEGYGRKAGKRPIVHRGAKFRQAARNTPVSEMEPDLITGEPIPPQYTMAVSVSEDARGVQYKDYGDLDSRELSKVERGFEELFPDRPKPRTAKQWKHFYNAYRPQIGARSKPAREIERETGRRSTT
jgi:hypothetical protein